MKKVRLTELRPGDAPREWGGDVVVSAEWTDAGFYIVTRASDGGVVQDYECTVTIEE